MVHKIALEEHFLSPGFEDYWRTTVGNVDPKVATNLLARLTDFGGMRLESMDHSGIARSVLAIAGPGVQSETRRFDGTPPRRASRTTFSPAKSRSVPTAIPALPTCRCRTPWPPPTNSNAACENSSFVAP